MENMYYPHWEQELLYQFITDNKCRKKAYVCSPLSARTEEGFLRNMQTARAYMFYAMKEINLSARAPHAYLPMLLCDRIPSERALALQFGLRLLEESEILLICGNRISSGMRGEISHAAKLDMPMACFDEDVYLEVKKELTRCGKDKRAVRLDREHSLLGLTDPLKYLENAAAS